MSRYAMQWFVYEGDGHLCHPCHVCRPCHHDMEGSGGGGGAIGKCAAACAVTWVSSSLPGVPQGLVDVQERIFPEAGWDFQEHEEPFFIWRITCTHVLFALERGVLNRFAYGVVKRFPTTLEAFLRLNHKTSLALRLVHARRPNLDLA